LYEFRGYPNKETLLGLPGLSRVTEASKSRSFRRRRVESGLYLWKSPYERKIPVKTTKKTEHVNRIRKEKSGVHQKEGGGDSGNETALKKLRRPPGRERNGNVRNGIN